MNIDRLRHLLFYLLCGGKFLVFLWIIFLWVGNSYTDVQVIELLQLILPLFVTNVVLAITYFLKRQSKADDSGQEAALGPIKFVAISFAIGYTVFLIFFTGYYATLSGEGGAFITLKTWVTVAETLFGTCLGLVVTALYTFKA